MYRRVSWMKAADHAILQILSPPKRLALRSGDIAYNAELSQQWTSERLGVLVEHGLVEKIEEENTQPRYRITERGKEYLDGEIEVGDLEEQSK